MIEWHGLDTETERGRAVLVTTERAAYPVTAGLAAVACWLASQGRDFVAWNMDYDARALLALLPRSIWSRFARRENATWRGLRILYIPGKVLRLSWGRRGHVVTVSVYDAMQHYGCALETAGQRVFREGKNPFPRAWLSKMGALLRGGGWRAKKIVLYAIQDAALCLKLWEHCRVQLDSLGLDTSEPYSGASMAVRAYRERTIGAKASWRVNALFGRAYYGGRIELWQSGRIGPWRVHDMHSAYPWALSTLPDPRGLEERLVTAGPSRDALYGAYRVRVTVPFGTRVPPLPFRSRLGLLWPTGTWETWLTLPELLALHGVCYPEDGLLAATVTFDLLGGLELCGERRPFFPEILALYAERAKRPELALGIKLILNGLYGRFAYSREGWVPSRAIGAGSERVDGEWCERAEWPGNTQNMAVASHVTALVRLRLWEAARLAPERVVAIATDSIYWRGSEPIPGLATGPGLGQWGEAESGPDSVFVLPGVYAVQYGSGLWHEKGRGFRVSGDALLKALDVRRKTARLPVTEAATITQAIRRGDPEAMNVIRRARRTLDPNGNLRRIHPFEWSSCKQILSAVRPSCAPNLA